MHFTNIFTAALILPAMSMVAALPAMAPESAADEAHDLMTRQAGTTCDQYSAVATGQFVITNSLNYDLIGIRVTDGGVESDDPLIGTITKGQTKTVQINADGGNVVIKICDKDTKKSCNYPAGRGTEGQTRDFILRASGDRWVAKIALAGDERSWVSTSCTIGNKL